MISVNGKTYDGVVIKPDIDDLLEHHGVKGQKWGHRKKRTPLLGRMMAKSIQKNKKKSNERRKKSIEKYKKKHDNDPNYVGSTAYNKRNSEIESWA